MHTTTHRIVSLIAAVTLLITCTITGLVLPISAEEPTDVVYTQDFQNGTDGWLFSDKAFETVEDPADATNQVAALSGVGATDYMLESSQIKTDIVVGDRYIVRVKAKTASGTKTRFSAAFYNKEGGGFQGGYYDITTTEWMYFQYAFTAVKNATSVVIGFYLETSGVTAYVDDIQLIKVGENTNLVSGGDMEGAKTQLLLTYYGKGATVVNDDLNPGNHALHVPADKKDYWLQLAGCQANKIYEISFRYRGGSIAHWWSDHSALYQNVGSKSATATWQQFKAYIQTKSTTTGNFFMIRTDTNTALSGARDVWMDDIVVREVSSVALPETATVERGSTITLTPTLTPADAQLTKFTWATDNDAVATVANGVVTAVAEGTANITATAGPLSATCAVTVTKPTAKGVVLDKETTSLIVGETDTLTATVQPDGAELPGEFVWTTDNDKVATVANGVITAVSEGAANVTVTCGTLTATCTVTVKPVPKFSHPNGDFEGGDVSGYVNGKTPVPVLKEENGNHYIQIPANGGLITGPTINYTVKAGDWFRVSFKVRKNASAKMRFGVNMYNVFDGYGRPDWTMEQEISTSGNGEWFQYTAYAQAKNTTSEFYLGFLEIVDHTTADTTLDLDDIEIELLDIESNYELDRFYGGDFENGNIASLNDYGFGGLFNDGGVITQDPEDATNHVLHMTKSSQAYFLASPYTLQSGNTKSSYVMQTNSYYKLTYRQKGTGTTAPGITGDYGTRLSVSGSPDKASSEWKTITAYYKTGASMNSNYCFNFQTSGDVYLDDFTLYRLPAATELTLTTEEMTLTAGDTETLEVETAPENAYVGTITWTSDNEAVATVANGVITAVSEGTATITVTNGTLVDTCTVTVNKLMATELLLNKGAVTMLPGTSETLTVSVSPVGGWYDTVVWTSENESVATVEDGVVKALKDGVTTIVAASGELMATCTVTVLKDLVVGGDFEEGRIGNFSGVGASNTSTWYIAEGKGFGGGNALAIDYRKSDRLMKWPTFAPNTTYSLTFVAKGPSIIVQLWKYSGSASGWENVTTSDYGNGWTQYRVEFTTGADGLGPSSGYANYSFIFKRNEALEDTTAVTYVDNFSIVPTDRSDNRIVGGDFEVPGPRQWETSFLSDTTRGIKVVTEEDGNKALFLPASATKFGDKYLKALKLKTDTDYVLTFKAKGDPIDLYFHGDSVKGALAGHWRSTDASDDYVTYTYSFSTASSTNQNYIINITRNTSIGTEKGTWLDDVSIREAGVEFELDEFFVLGGKDEVKPGTELTFGVKISNRGTSTFVGTLPINFRVNGNVWNTVNLECTLKAGDTITVLSSDVWTAVTGNYAVSVKVNPEKELPEGDFYNNEEAFELRVADAPLTAPNYAQNAGFDKLTFSDDFDTIDTIDTKATGEAGYKWYVTRPYGASTLTTDDYKVENGILTLQETVPTYNYGLGTMDIKTGNGFTFNKGYLEVRFNIPRPRKNADGESGVPAIWSLPVERLRKTNNNHWVEMDWMEYWGINAYNKYYPKGFYTISMHEIKLNADGTTEYQIKNSDYGKTGLGDSQWHTMGWLWEENKITAYLDGKQVFTQSYSDTTKGTPTISKVEGTVPNGVYTLLNEQVMPLIISGSADNPLQIDYVRIWQDDGEEVKQDIAYADVTVDGGDIAINAAGAIDTTVTKGETVTVNTQPEEGYIMKPGSLKYITEDGKEVRILNQSLTDFTFGGGDGHTFEFKMPEGATKVTAEFVSTENTGFAMDTIGTSIRIKENGTYDGIRFLTRMNLATEFNAETSELHVKYNGKDYEVVEIGSVLSRYENSSILDLNNHQWKYTAYSKGGDFRLVDYTNSYIDFAVTMTKGAKVSQESFYARKYTARGYIKLKGADGSETVVYCDTKVTNCINEAVVAAN